MTHEQEIATLVEVLRRIAKHAMAGTGHEAFEVAQLLDSISRDDGEKCGEKDGRCALPPDPRPPWPDWFDQRSVYSANLCRDRWARLDDYVEELEAQRDALKKLCIDPNAKAIEVLENLKAIVGGGWDWHPNHPLFTWIDRTLAELRREK